MHVKVQKTRVRFPKALKTNLTEIVEMNTDKARIITIDKLARLHNATCKKLLYSYS